MPGMRLHLRLCHGRLHPIHEVAPKRCRCRAFCDGRVLLLGSVRMVTFEAKVQSLNPRYWVQWARGDPTEPQDI